MVVKALIKKKCDLRVRQWHEIEKGQSDHEAYHRILVNYVDFIDQDLRMGVKAKKLERDFLFRAIVFSEVGPVRGEKVVDGNGYKGDGFKH